MVLKKSFCWRSNLSNDDIIWTYSKSYNGYGFWMPGLKTGVENDIFWSEIRSRFGEPGSTSPPRIPRSNPRVTRVGKKISINCLNGGGGGRVGPP